MPKDLNIHKIAVIGSGPIVIGQAAEFDYAGSQACLSLREEGYEVVLINSNPATIMTDDEIADEVYLDPISLDSVSAILAKERPDALLPTLGGQTGLNMAVELNDAGVLAKYNIKLLGTSLETINQAEDRESFKELMQQLHQPIPASLTVHTLADAVKFADEVGYPVIVRPAYTLGGTGGGIANDHDSLVTIGKRGLALSPATECLIEKSIAGYKEIEYEVMRDQNGDKISVCNMENFDPVGIHTGDSIVVAPSQTLTDTEYQRLRHAALEIVEALDIKGGCNVQLAQDPDSDQYYVIEVNPRVSRSSALASKATGYPIAKIAAKIAVGLNLSEIQNPVTKTTYAAFEPALDYVVAKIPRLPFDKFTSAQRQLGTQMKATGEVMGIGLTLEEALLKSVASLEVSSTLQAQLVPAKTYTDAELADQLQHPTDQRLFELFAALKRGWSLTQIADLTQINLYFLHKLNNIWQLFVKLGQTPLTAELLATAKQNGFSDDMIAAATGKTAADIQALRHAQALHPIYKMVDTCAGEFASETPYFYSSYFLGENESQPLTNSIVVIGSGPIRIGQGVEFDYTTVHCVQAIQQAGYKAIIINNNPETVSTDFSISDKLYFEPLTIESVMNIIELEQPLGVIVQFGGQTAINLTSALAAQGVKILGTSLHGINQTEDRHEFEALLQAQHIRQAPGATAMNLAEAKAIAPQVGYPVMVRPSYVLGGRAMAEVHNEAELETYVAKAMAAAPNQPILIDHYVTGRECEVDILSDGKEIFIPGIMEHLEGAGIHSGDSIAIYPPQHLTAAEKTAIIAIATKIGKQVHCVGMMNIQFICADAVYVIDVNPRASRTVPFMSKVTGHHLAKLATRLILGESLAEVGLHPGCDPEPETVAVKAPVFSFMKLPGMATALSPEMKSTGETIGRGADFPTALKAALVDSYHFPAATPGKIALLDPTAATDTDLSQALTQSGYQPVTITQADQLADYTSDQVALVINGAQEQDTAEPLNYFALSQNVPFFSATATIKGILAALNH